MKIRRTGAFKKWFRKLRDQRAKALILTRIDRLADGNRGDWKSVSGNLFEIRIDYGPGYRVYCKDAGEEIVILLCGGDKTTQETDIKNARKLALEPMEEEENGNSK